MIVPLRSMLSSSSSSSSLRCWARRVVSDSSPTTVTKLSQVYTAPAFRQASAMSTAAAAIKSDDEHEDEPAAHSLFLILGKPGGGKGTICGKILADFPSSFRHLSTGDILRDHVRQETDLGVEARRYMDAGALVPDQLMIELLLKEDVLATCSSVSLLLDGFPRTLQQAVALEENNIHVNHVINLDVPTEVIVERISDRWIHAPSGRVYSYSYKPPKVHGKDDVTGEDLVQRQDDKPESVRERLAKYDEMTSPLVEYYQSKGILQNFQGTESDIIYPKVRNFLQDDVGIST